MRRQKPGCGRRRQRAGGGTVARTSATHSSSGSSPAISLPSAPVTGAPTPARSSARASSGTDSSASTAWPTPRGSPPRARRGEQLAGAAVAALRGQRRGHQVAGAGQADHRLRPRAQPLGIAPDLGEDVPGGRAGGVQPLRLGGARGERRGVLGRARELDADGVVGLLAHDAGAGEHLGERARELLIARGGHQRGAGVHHLLRVRRATEAGDPLGAEARAQHRRRRQSLGGTRPLATDTTAARLPRPAGAERGDHLAQAARGHRQEHVVGARHAGGGRLDAQLRGQLDPRQVDAVLALARRAARPARRCASAASCAVRRGPAAPPAPCRRNPPRSPWRGRPGRGPRARPRGARAGARGGRRGSARRGLGLGHLGDRA